MGARKLPQARLRLEELEARLTPSTTTSTNWSGYAVTAATGSVTAVSGSWQVPQVTPSGTSSAYSAAWVGIDGYSSNSVEQLGTSSDVVNGVPQYYAWYEIYPAPSRTITSLKIQPGDTVSASVTYSSVTKLFTLSITDANDTSPYNTFSISLSYPKAQRSSAEWIQEAPSSGWRILPLSNFGTINFSQAQATIAGNTGAIDNTAWGSNVEQINLVSAKHVVEDTTSAVTDSGSTSNFSVTFQSSGKSSSTTSGGHGSSVTTSKSNNLGADPSAQTVLAGLANQISQQAADRAAVAQASLASSVTAFAVFLPGTGTPLAPLATVNSASVLGPTRLNLSNFLAAPNSSGSSEGGQEGQPSDDDENQAPANPAPLKEPDTAVQPVAKPSLCLSDACFLSENGLQLTAENPSELSNATDAMVLAVEPGVDALVGLALGGVVGLAAEKGANSRRALKLR